MRPATFAILVATLCLTSPASSSDSVALGRYLELRVEDENGDRRPLADEEIEIDRSLLVDWDETALRAALAGREGGGVAERAESRDLEALRDLVVAFLEAQAALAEAKAAGPGGPRASALANEANERFAVAGTEALESFEAYRGALRASGEEARADALDEAMFAAVQDDYAAMAGVIRNAIDRLDRRVSRALAESDRYAMVMTATLHASTGVRPVHLEGYDRIPVGDPTPVPRFQFDLDERAEAEIRAADQLGRVVRQAIDGELRAQLDRAVRAVEAELATLRTTLRTDALEGNVRETLGSIEGAAERELGPVRDEGENLLRTLRSLTLDVPPFDADGSGELLLTIVRTVTAELRTTTVALSSLETRLDGFTAAVRSAAEALPGRIESDVVAAFEEAIARVRGDPEIAAVVRTLESVGDALGFTAEIGSDALAAAAGIPRDVLEGLDTRLDLLTAGERHSGDLLLITAELRLLGEEGEDAVVVSRTFRRIRVRQYGVRASWRGALLFADARRGDLAVDQTWEPAPAISYMFHRGARGSRFWNDILDPGIGITATVLDFEDDDDFELGLAASASFLRGLLWVGYGRNLQAETDFFHVGINPLVVGRIWREGRAGP